MSHRSLSELQRQLGILERRAERLAQDTTRLRANIEAALAAVPEEGTRRSDWMSCPRKERRNTPVDERILNALRSQPTMNWTSRMLKDALGEDSNAVGFALTDLYRSGAVKRAQAVGRCYFVYAVNSAVETPDVDTGVCVASDPKDSQSQP